MQQAYDVVVIGSGTAGQTAAHALKRHGLSVVLADHADRPGGTCALAGCQAKKWFYEATELVARSRHLIQKGIRTAAVADWAQILKEKNKFTSMVPDNTVRELKNAGIDYIQGHARFLDDKTIAIKDYRFTPEYIVIAAGAAPIPLPFDGAEFVTPSDRFLELRALPRRIVFVGGGFISFEFAHFAARLGQGATQCAILEAGPRPLGPFDAEMVDLLVEISAQFRIEVFCNVKIDAVTQTDRGLQVITDNGMVYDTDLVVHGAGRLVDAEELGLQEARIDFNRRGITVTSKMATSNPNIYAVGDCVDSMQLARVADMEAQVAADNIAARKFSKPVRPTMEYPAVPTVLFTYPQYAMVGMSEAGVKQKGMDYVKSFAKKLTWPTYKRVGLKDAAFKILAERKGNILGAHIISDNASGLINTFSLAMTNKIPVERLYRQSILTPYPSRESDIIYMLKALMRR